MVLMNANNSGKSDPSLFNAIIHSLLDGQTVGFAARAFAPRYAAVLSIFMSEFIEQTQDLFSASTLSPSVKEEIIDNLSKSLRADDFEDIRKYVIIGDPAARLRVDDC